MSWRGADKLLLPSESMQAEGQSESHTAGANSLTPISTTADAGSPAGDDFNLLLARMDSPDFTLFECLWDLSRFAGNIGVHYQLCQRLLTYPPHQIEFYLPQLVQIYVSIETESAALEDFLLYQCNQSTHCTLIIFWHLQASLSDLADSPQSYGFAAAKRLYNKLQYLLFALGDRPSDAMRDNAYPALILASMVAAASAVPDAGRFIRPLVVSQGRKQRSHLLRVANKIKRTVSGAGASNKHLAPEPKIETAPGTAGNTPEPDEGDARVGHRQGHPFAKSMPDLSKPATDAYDLAARRMSGDIGRVPDQNKLKTNYFRCETQFVYSLQSISNRLVRVPKAARLSALQLELALLNRDLPAEVDIPLLIPAGPGNQQNRIVRISPTEATVLNSAEKAPFLLLVEYLKGDLTFNPDTDRNRHLLANNGQRKYLFDRSFAGAPPAPGTPLVESTFNEEEQDLGSVSVSEREELNDYRFSGPTSVAADAAAAVDLAAANAVAQVFGDDGDQEDDDDNGDRQLLASPLTKEEARAAEAAESVSQPVAVSVSDGVEEAIEDAAEYEDDGEVRGKSSRRESITDLATQMHTASIILAQLEGVEGAKLPKSDIASIKARIVANMQAMQDHDVLIKGEAGARKLENDLKTAGLTGSDDPSAANLAEDWTARKKRLRKSSPFGHYPTWDLFSVIVKTGDDLRQEAIACQFIQRAQQIWREAHIDVWVKQMRILITSSNSGLVETITNGLSIHSIKKALTSAKTQENGQPPRVATLKHHFEAKFGAPSGVRYRHALQNFVKSLAAYSILSYILQIKDRHNGNILLDNEGHIIHIDFGFMLSNAPGGRISLESAPFKLTHEYVDLMGGTSSTWFKQYLALMKEAFRTLRKHADEFVVFVEIMGKDSKLPCFQNGPATATLLRQRFHTYLSDDDLDTFVENNLVYKSYGSVYTRLYDQFQMHTQGIYS